MITVEDKIFILRAVKGGAKFFLNRKNINTILEMRDRLGKEKMDQITTILREV